VILCELTGCLSHWEKSIKDTIVFPDINRLVKKYSPFIEYEKSKMKQILLDKYNAIV